MTAPTWVYVADPPPVTDGHGREWVWDADLFSYVYEDSHAVMLRSLEQIQAQFGLAVDGPPPGRHSDAVSVPDVVHNRGEGATQVMPAVQEGAA